MTFHAIDSRANAAAFFVVILSIPLSVLATSLRFVATHKTKRKPGHEDWFAVVAVVAAIISSAMQLTSIIKLNGWDPIMLAVLKSGEYAHIMKIVFAAQEFWVVQQVFSKLSILALYRRIFGISRSNTFWIVVIGFVQIAHGFICFFMQAFACSPVKKFWEPLVPGKCMTKTVLIVAEPINSAVDFALVVLAICMLQSLQLSVANKWRLGFLFGLGGLAGVIGFIKIGMSYTLSVADSFAVLSMWSTLQSLVGIVCCCAPVYSPIIPSTKVWRKIQSTWSNITGSKRSSNKGSGGYSQEEHYSMNQRSSRNRAWESLDGDSRKGLVHAQTKPGTARDVEEARPGAMYAHRSVEVD